MEISRVLCLSRAVSLPLEFLFSAARVLRARHWKIEKLND